MTPLLVLFIIIIIYLFACRMARGYKEVSNSQAGCQRGTPQETLTTSSLVVVTSVEELRLYNQVLVEINLEMSNDPTTST